MSTVTAPQWKTIETLPVPAKAQVTIGTHCDGPYINIYTNTTGELVAYGDVFGSGLLHRESFGSLDEAKRIALAKMRDLSARAVEFFDAALADLDTKGGG